MQFKFIVLLILINSLSSCSVEELVPYEENLEVSLEQTEVENQMLGLINEHRQDLNLNELLFDSTSYYYAGEHTSYMISKGHTSHAQFDERAQLISEETGAESVAENVAKGYDNMEIALEAWLNSPSHKKNLEGDFTYSALSIKKNENGEMYFTQIFLK